MLSEYKKGTLPFTPKCSYDLLNRQLNLMVMYKACLEKRAKIENIKL